MDKKERLQFFLIWLALGVLPLGLRGLWETDEARYAEIPREMLALGDWLVPRLNYVLYFEKPPLQYWLSAIGMKVLGETPFAARLPLALGTALSMWAAWSLARRLGARRPILAAFMVPTALLGFVGSNALSLDGLFSSWMVAAFAMGVESIAARYEGRAALAWTLGAFTCTAMAVLTKTIAAPVLLGGIFLLAVPFAWRNVRLRKAILGFVFHPLGLLLLFALSFPWFYLVNRAHPGHANFFFIHEHFERYTSHVHARQGSDNPFLDKLFFLPILLLGLLPWLSASFLGIKRALMALKKGAKQEITLQSGLVLLLLMGIAVPFLFFSLSGSKLPLYILPVLVPCLALAEVMRQPEEMLSVFRRQAVELLLVGAVLAFGGAFLFQDALAPGWIVGVGAGFILLGLWMLFPRYYTRKRGIAALASILIFLAWSAERSFGRVKSPKHLIEQAPKEAQWISAGYYFQSLPLVTKAPVVVVCGTGELEYGRDHLPEAKRAEWFTENFSQLNHVATRMKKENVSKPVWALVDSSAWVTLAPALKSEWQVVDANKPAFLVKYKG